MSLFHFSKLDFMKNLIFIFVCQMVLLHGVAQAQGAAAVTAAGGCTAVTVTQIPQYPIVYSVTAKKECRVEVGDGECCIVFPWQGTMTLMLPKLRLERFNPSTNSWDFVIEVKGGAGQVFSNLTQGRYRVLVILPYYNENTCKTDAQGNIIQTRVQILNESSQFLGYLGTYDNSPFGGNCFCYSNEVLIGATTASDISYTFVDPTPNDPYESGYDFGEVAKMNTAACKDYDLWWLAIFEDGPTYHRYRSNGWTNGTVPNNEFNLTAFWGQSGSGWQFETFHSYTVQFVIENAQCRNGIEQNPPATWNVLARTFFICPAGTGCRIGEDAQKIALSPNPASSVVRLLHFEMDAGREYRLYITDLTGRTVHSTTLSSNEVDISGLGYGMYAVTIERDGKRIFADKLVVNQ